MNPDAIGRSFEVDAALDRDHDEEFRELVLSRASVTGTAHPLLLARPLSLLFHLAIDDPAFAGEADRMVHVDQRSWFRRPVPIGAVVHARATIVGVGRYGSNAGVQIATEVLLDRATVFDGSSTFVAIGSAHGEHLRLDAPRASREMGPVVAAAPPRRITLDEVRQYARISGDLNPIHTSPDRARAAGLDGPVVHGMFTLALVGSAAIDLLAEGDASRLTHLAARFNRFVAVGGEVAIDLRSTSDPASSRAVVTSDRRRVLRDAVVEIAPTT